MFRGHVTVSCEFSYTCAFELLIAFNMGLFVVVGSQWDYCYWQQVLVALWGVWDPYLETKDRTPDGVNIVNDVALSVLLFLTTWLLDGVFVLIGCLCHSPASVTVMLFMVCGLKLIDCLMAMGVVSL
ncbi:hypothetical protein AVEN_203896-1 [Araneus ventricosus]|uniref:Uncharacterized protein n=1 Tax=Araneus ventricosus TaxID=182803 RepID=A0A4Y2DFT7_ARAVE|nr:hypothetical protein AVEN_203896-1 [Araneus ventricosus]